MKSEHRAKNREVIKNAFKRFVLSKDRIVEIGMYNVLENVVRVALEAHNEEHQNHIEIGDTYGWMLVHNHKVVEITAVATDDNRGDVMKQLRKQLRTLPKTGWQGVVMAGMNPANYFSFRYEYGTLMYAANVTKTNFSQFFKPL